MRRGSSARAAESACGLRQVATGAWGDRGGGAPSGQGQTSAVGLDGVVAHLADELLEQPAVQVGPGGIEGPAAQPLPALAQHGVDRIDDQPAGAIEVEQALRGRLPAVGAHQVPQGQAVAEGDLTGDLGAQVPAGPFGDQESVGQGQLQQGPLLLRVIDARHPLQGIARQGNEPGAVGQWPVLWPDPLGHGLDGVPGSLRLGRPLGVGGSLGIGKQPPVAPAEPELETVARGAECQRGRQPIGHGPVLPQPPEAERQEGGERQGPQ